MLSIRKITKTLILLTILILTVSNTAYTQIKQIFDVPFKMKFVVSDNGIYLISDNGRLLVKGNIFDIWNGKHIKDADDILALNKINIKTMQIPYKQWGVKLRDNSSDPVIVFIDVNDNKTIDFLEKLEKSIYKSIYIFALSSDENNTPFLKQIYCSPIDERYNILKSMFNNTYIKQIEQVNCNIEGYLSVKIMANLFQLQKYPALIINDTLKYELE